MVIGHEVVHGSVPTSDAGGGKVLVIGPSWVGDMVMAQSLYRVLAERAPRPEIHVVAPAWSLPILERMPEVTRGIELDVGHGELGLKKRMRLGFRLELERYEQAIVLPRSLKAALVPWFARVPRRTGFRGEFRYGLLNDVRRFDPRGLAETVRRFMALGLERNDAPPSAVPRPALTVDRDNLDRLRTRLDLWGETVALIPGAAYGPAKRWPAEQYAELASRLAHIGAAVLILGSARERPIGERIVELAGSAGVVNLCGDTTLIDAVDLLGASAAAVTNDTGLMHVAASVGTHVVAIYGSSSPRLTPPLTDARTVLYRHLDCSPCLQRTCPFGHLRCLREISVDTVFDAIEPRVTEQFAVRARADA